MTVRRQLVKRLPECIYNRVKVKLSDSEIKIYDDLSRDMVVDLKDKEIDAVNAASLSNKLLQIANGAIYDENKNAIHIHDRKLDALEDLIESANGKAVLVHCLPICEIA